jgi:hypothetical protein
MKFIQKKSDLINYLFWLIIIAQLTTLVKDIFQGFPIDSFGITEYLINYEGGFVRRGLTGQLLLYLYRLTHISPYYFIVIISVFTYLSVIVFCVKYLTEKSYPVFFLPFVFFLGNPVISSFWLRKDSLMLCLFTLVVFCIKKRSPIHLIFANLILVSGILIHEATGFLTIPISIVLIFSLYSANIKHKSLFERIFRSFIFIMPSIIVFFLVLYFKGDQKVAKLIWLSWKDVRFPVGIYNPDKLPAAIEGISLTLKYGLFSSLYNLVNFNNDIYAPLAWVIIISIVYFILTNTERLSFKINQYKPQNIIDKKYLGNILIFQFIAVIPLFILGCDYGRWVFLWVISSFVLMLLFDDEKDLILFPKFIITFRNKFIYFLSMFISASSVPILSLIISVPLAGWSLKNCIESNTFISLITFISNLIKPVVLILKNLIKYLYTTI